MAAKTESVKGQAKRVAESHIGDKESDVGPGR